MAEGRSAGDEARSTVQWQLQGWRLATQRTAPDDSRRVRVVSGAGILSFLCMPIASTLINYRRRFNALSCRSSFCVQYQRLIFARAGLDTSLPSLLSVQATIFHPPPRSTTRPTRARTHIAPLTLCSSLPPYPRTGSMNRSLGSAARQCFFVVRLARHAS